MTLAKWSNQDVRIAQAALMSDRTPEERIDWVQTRTHRSAEDAEKMLADVQAWQEERKGETRAFVSTMTGMGKDVAPGLMVTQIGLGLGSLAFGWFLLGKENVFLAVVCFGLTLATFYYAYLAYRQSRS